MNLNHKICLITGSAVRVGKSIALTLASSNAKVVIHYHTREKEVNETYNQIRENGAEAMIVQGDISKINDWQIMHKKILDHWGKIDVLINNAAIFYRTPFFHITEKDWNKFLNINLKGTFYGCKIIGKTMYKNKFGKIVNIADVASYNVWPNYIPYCISKAGVVALTKGLAKALAPFVTVNAVSPGTVMLAENYDENEESSLISRTPLQKIGDPQDIANTVKFLLEGSDFITGTIINVDGGRSLT
jgi:NAD(P)-dependent dehydrogenase (short-subunit alcohol dehydrogenase family)